MKLEEQRWAEVDYLVAAELHSKSELKKLWPDLNINFVFYCLTDLSTTKWRQG